MRKNTCGGLPVANLHLENVKMNDLNRNLLATVATQNGDFSDVLKELETAKANLAEAQDIIARANRFGSYQVTYHRGAAMCPPRQRRPDVKQLLPH